MASEHDERQERISETIARVIGREIADGTLSTGAPLPSERKLAERFGSSRSSAREALRLLQAGGLISNRSKARAIVGNGDQHRFLEPLTGAAKLVLARPGGRSDFEEARMLFECGLARYAARRATKEDLEKLRAALNENEAAIGNPRRFSVTDAAFHSVLASIPKNSLFAALDMSVAEWRKAKFSRKTADESRGLQGNDANRLAYRHHKAIFEAIEARDPEKADAAMAAHLSVGVSLILKQLRPV